MCRISNYPALYTKAGEILRHEGLNYKTPGFELLKAAVVVYKVEGKKQMEAICQNSPDKKVAREEAEKAFYEKVKESTSSPVPSISPVITNRHPVEQWMTEALREKGIKVDVITFIEDIASML